MSTPSVIIIIDLPFNPTICKFLVFGLPVKKCISIRYSVGGADKSSKAVPSVTI